MGKYLGITDDYTVEEIKERTPPADHNYLYLIEADFLTTNKSVIGNSYNHYQGRVLGPNLEVITELAHDYL